MVEKIQELQKKFNIKVPEGELDWPLREQIINVSEQLCSHENLKLIEEDVESLVPSSGPAKTLLGELVRAVMKIEYRAYNDGDTLNASAVEQAGRWLYKKLWELEESQDSTYQLIRDCICPSDLVDGITLLLREYPEAHLNLGEKYDEYLKGIKIFRNYIYPGVYIANHLGVDVENDEDSVCGDWEEVQEWKHKR